MSDTKLIVLVGPYRVARRYAQARGWSDDSYAIVVRAHQLRSLDPSRIAAIFTLKLHALAKAVVEELWEEIDKVGSLWPIEWRVAA